MFSRQIHEYRHQVNKDILTAKKVQDAQALAPLFFATLFPIIRYQIKPDAGESCWFFCEFIPLFRGFRINNEKIAILHKAFTALPITFYIAKKTLRNVSMIHG